MRWIKDEIDPVQVRSMAKTYGIDTLTASILARRKVTEPGQVLYYLENDPRYLHNPFLFEAMEDAVDRILLAADEGEKVMVFGDSDTDGVTATTLMVEALASAKIETTWRVPCGEEPYGLSIQAVEEFAAAGGSLIVTVDCGISNHAEVERAAELGVDVIICDHHKLQSPEPPAALAVIDPKIEGCGYPFRDLAGAGVAYKLAGALAFGRSELYKQPVALLNIGKESPASAKNDEPADQTAPPRYHIEAARLHNLVETARFVETIEEGSPRTGAILEKLAKFLSGRSIFTWRAASQRAAARAVFGAGVDIQWYDLADEVVIALPEFAEKTLADVGVELKLARYAASGWGDIDALKALFVIFAQRRIAPCPDEGEAFLQLATLGTIADLMPLRDENRIIVKRGIQAMGNSPCKGIADLLQVQGLGRSLSSTEIAWQVTPLLNAAGRLGRPEIALDLLLSSDPSAREKAVQDIVKANAERKKMGADTWEAVYPLARESYEANEHRFVIVRSTAARAGITGLLASRMVGVFKVPSIVAAFKEDGTIVGSIRAANNFRVSGLLAACAELFIDYGGHDAAAGFSLTADRWERFEAIAVEHLKSAELADDQESIAVDAELPHAYLRPELRSIYAIFEPFGEENRPLVFMARGVPMVDAQIVGKAAKNHLKLTLDFGKYKWPALLWDGAERLERDFSFRAKDRIDLLFKVTVNRWNGEEKPQLELYDVRRERVD